MFVIFLSLFNDLVRQTFFYRSLKKSLLLYIKQIINSKHKQRRKYFYRSLKKCLLLYIKQIIKIYNKQQTMNTQEIFKPIAGYDNYEVSNLGHVRNNKTGRILAIATSNTGYSFVSLSKNGKNKSHSIHRLVLETFDPKDNMKELDVNHIDWDKTNNTLENLEWTTRQENLLHGSGPTELKRLESMLCNAIKVTLHKFYDQLLTVKCTQQTFTTEVVEQAIINATNFYNETH